MNIFNNKNNGKKSIIKFPKKIFIKYIFNTAISHKK